MESGMITTADGFREAYAEIFAHVSALAAGLDDERAMLPTRCPGWTVRDHVAHITDIESTLIGWPRVDHTVPEGLAHVRNEFGAFMEIGVDARRGVPLAVLLAEYEDVTAARLALLANLQEAQLDEMGRGIFGESKIRSILGIRVFDLWTHEQDIRSALNAPGGLDGVAAAHSRERMLVGAAYELQKRVAPPAGTALVFDIAGPGGARRSITFDGQKGQSGEIVSDSPSATLRLDLPTLTVLTCGRDDPDARSRVTVEGDQNLARVVLEDLAVTP